MEEIIITGKTLLSFAGVIITLGGASAIITKIIKNKKQPHTDIIDKLKSHDTMLNNDNKRLNDLEAGNRVQCKMLLALADHSITGNSVNKLKEAKNEMQDYLINR